ncbi:MAG: NAD(P)-dependent oxidoreductase, partial [Bdellovibrionota bacterium]
SETSKLAPFNIYGLSKLMGEQLLQLESRNDPSLRLIVGRLFNLIGPRETNPHILPEILSQLKKNPHSPLRLGSLWPKRDLVPVREAARSIVEALKKAEPGLSTINFATGVARSMQEVIETLGEIRGKKIEVETDQSKVRAVERPHLQADVSKLKALIGITPSSDLKVALKELLIHEGMLS